MSEPSAEQSGTDDTLPASALLDEPHLPEPAGEPLEPVIDHILSDSDDTETGTSLQKPPAVRADEPAPARAPLRKRRGFMLAAGTLVSHYEVIRPLGKGGHGQVYLARDTLLGRLVALKFLTLTGQGRLKRFMVEARATAQFKHEHVVTLYEIGEHGEYPYMALEYVEGQSLRSWLDERIARTAEQWQFSETLDQDSEPADETAPASQRITGVSAVLAAELMLPVVQALVRSHELGIVHRDLKPQNIMLTDAGTIKVLDFGIAKMLDAANRDPEQPGFITPRWNRNLTQAGGLVGTLRYMSPEQWGADDIDERTDQWAVGLMLYELVSGRHPMHPLTRDKLTTVARLHEPMPLAEVRASESGQFAEVVKRCLRKDKAERFESTDALARMLAQVVEAGRAGEQARADRNPYPGLHSFQESDADRFFGREREVSEVVRALAERPLLAVVGPSGAGKSSFVRAGVIPTLKRSGETWEAHIMRPGPRPLAAMAELLDGDRDTIEAELRATPGVFGTRLRDRARTGVTRQLLFIDQFEEIFTLTPADDREHFMHCLSGAADDAGSPLRVMVAMRSDFLDRMAAESGPVARLISRGLSLMQPMSRAGMRAALVQPLAPTGYGFESEAMVEDMLDTLEDTTGALPLLQFAAARQWEIRDTERRILSEASYHKMGGIGGTLAQHADAVIAAMASGDAAIARALMLRLVTPERTRALVTLGELRASIGAEADAIDEVLARLIDARLLTSDGGGDAESMVEIVHESLIDNWPMFGQWLDDHAEDGVFLAKLRPAAAEWDRSGRDVGFLWTGAGAREATHWHDMRGERVDAGLGERERAFLLAVTAFAERARRRRRWALIAGMTILAAVSLVVSYLAVRANREAARVRAKNVIIEQREAEAQREARLARNATRMAKAHEYIEDPTTVLALLREVEPPTMPRGWSELAWQTLHSSVAEVVLTHEHPVLDADFSPDGQRIVTAGGDGLVRIWPSSGDGEPMVLRGHEKLVRTARYSPDGRFIVTASEDHTARVWRANGSGEPVVWRGHEDEVLSAAFSPDGQRVVTGSRDDTVRVWRVDGTGRAVVLREHQGDVWSAAFSPDGQRIISASDDETARIWTVDGSREPLVLTGHDEAVVTASFSPDGKSAATASLDKTARIWNTIDATQTRVLRGHTNMLNAVSFSTDGRYIITASMDHTARLWSMDDSGSPVVLRGHSERLFSAVFSTDETRVVTSSQDGTARVWELSVSNQTEVISVSESWVFTAVPDPQGTRIATGSQDGAVRIFNIRDGGEPVVYRHSTQVREVVFSPDGQLVASASWDNTAQVRRADGSGTAVVFSHPDAALGVAFTNDGLHVLTACGDGNVRQWPSDGVGAPKIVNSHGDVAWGVAVSPDGTRALSTSFDRTIRVWPLAHEGELPPDHEPLVFAEHRGTVWSAVFSPDGSRIASVSDDETVRIWHADGTGSTLVLTGHSAPIYRVAFSPDGTRVVSASQDKTVRIWNADGSGEPLILRGHTDAVNGAAFVLDGNLVVSASKDGTVRIWSDLEPVNLEDPRLWALSEYCMPIARRRFLLDVDVQRARNNRAACLRRITDARSR